MWKKSMLIVLIFQRMHPDNVCVDKFKTLRLSIIYKSIIEFKAPAPIIQLMQFLEPFYILHNMIWIKSKEISYWDIMLLIPLQNVSHFSIVNKSNNSTNHLCPENPVVQYWQLFIIYTSKQAISFHKLIILTRANFLTLCP